MPEPAASIPRVPITDLLRDVVFSDQNARVDMYGRLARMHDRYGEVVMQMAGPFKMVNLFGPDANRLVLLDREGIFSAQKPWTAIMGRIFPNGLLLKDGADHKYARRIMHEAFKRPALRSYLDRMGPMVEEALDDWLLEDEISAFRSYKALTLDMAAAIFLGVDLGSETRAMNGVFEDLVAASMSRVRLPIPGLEFQRGLAGREKMKRWLGDLIPKKRAGDGPDMFTRFCHAETEAGERFRDEEIVDHLIFLMMAAHDTTTSTLTSMTYLLAKHPEWQERAREECLAMPHEQLDFDEQAQLTVLGWVMKETLRLYPPLPVIPRVATQAFEFKGYTIPEGSMTVVSPIHTHRMADWWPEPDRFDPGRFSPERAEDQRHTHMWVPFGGGPHHCLGIRFAELQVKTVMHQMLRRCRFSVPDDYVMPVQQAPISKPRDGLPITLEELPRQ